MTGEGMAQHVRMQMLAQLLDTVTPHPQLNGPGRQPPSLHADKHWLTGIGDAGSDLEPAAQRLPRLTPDRDDAGLVAFAQYPYLALADVQLVQIQPGQLGQTQARGVEQLEHG